MTFYQNKWQYIYYFNDLLDIMANTFVNTENVFIAVNKILNKVFIKYKLRRYDENIKCIQKCIFCTRFYIQN